MHTAFGLFLAYISERGHLLKSVLAFNHHLRSVDSTLETKVVGLGECCIGKQRKIRSFCC